jgi:hypothetical protein
MRLEIEHRGGYKTEYAPVRSTATPYSRLPRLRLASEIARRSDHHRVSSGPRRGTRG